MPGCGPRWLLVEMLVVCMNHSLNERLHFASNFLKVPATIYEIQPTTVDRRRFPSRSARRARRRSVWRAHQKTAPCSSPCWNLAHHRQDSIVQSTHISEETPRAPEPHGHPD